jgi:hypothetical protein
MKRRRNDSDHCSIIDPRWFIDGFDRWRRAFRFQGDAQGEAFPVLLSNSLFRRNNSLFLENNSLFG